jgi:hypothetical protein
MAVSESHGRILCFVSPKSKRSSGQPLRHLFLPHCFIIDMQLGYNGLILSADALGTG